MTKITAKNPKHLPHFSHAPWAGFTRGDKPRQKPLPLCPAPACRRARKCIAAHDGLYCRRTHMSRSEAEMRTPDPELKAFEATLPQPRFDKDFHIQAERATRRIEFNAERNARMTALWQSGSLDHLYGPYSKRGKWMEPPPRMYIDERG